MSLPSATQQKVLRLEQQVNDLLQEVATLKTTVQALQQGLPVPHDAADTASDAHANSPTTP